MKKVKELVRRHQVENSPFTIIENNDNFFLTCGRYRMTTKNFNNEKEVLEWIDQNHWELMATFCSLVAEETTKEILKNQTK
jgi:hypothetical protein